MRPAGLAILGTGTGVGKTVVTAAAGIALRRAGVRVTAWKPVATGGVRMGGALVSGDAIWLRRALGLTGPAGAFGGACWRTPAAPIVAARLERAPFDASAVWRRWRSLRAGPAFVLVEGVGGVLVPVSRGLTVADMVRRLGIPALIVGPAGLGAINHFLLSIEALRSRGVRVAGVVLNGRVSRSVPERTNPAVIAELGRTRVIGVLPRVPGVRRRRAGLLRLARCLDARSLLRAIREAR